MNNNKTPQLSKFTSRTDIQYIPRNMHTVFALLCFGVVIHWLIFAYPSGLLHWHCGNLTIAPVPAKQPWWTWINTSCEFIMNDCITTTKQSTTKPCAYFLGYTVCWVIPVKFPSGDLTLDFPMYQLRNFQGLSHETKNDFHEIYTKQTSIRSKLICRISFKSNECIMFIFLSEQNRPILSKLTTSYATIWRHFAKMWEYPFRSRW